MKFAYPILAILVIASVLASGCVQQGAPEGTGGAENQGGQQGGQTNPPPAPPASPPVMQPGAWSKVAMTTTSAKAIEFTYKSVEVTLGSIVYSGIETETSTGGDSLVLWEKGKATGAGGVKIYSLSKVGQLTLCNAITTEPSNMPGTQDPYANGAEGVTSLGTGTYTTPTGKTVSVNKYKYDKAGMIGEYWYSSQVPFVIVKSETNTTVVGREVNTKMELQDFGTGATSAFAQKDFEKCE